MITKIKLLKKYCSEYTKIENYEEALKSTLKYDLHHRLEISENKSRKQLIAENLYYGRPPEELVFLEHGEHMRLHNANMSDETKQKISEALKGNLVSEDTRKKMSEAHKGKPNHWKGKHRSEETRKKMSDAKKGKAGTCLGKHWTTENGRRIYTD